MDFGEVLSCRARPACLLLIALTFQSLERLFIGELVMRRLYLILASLCLLISATGLDAEEARKSDEISLPLKDFKFKIPQEQADLFSFDEDAQRLCFYTSGAAETKFSVENDGDYDLILSLAGDSAMKVRPKFKLAIDDKQVGK